jgi:hypothetical protein
MKLFLLNFMKN